MCKHICYPLLHFIDISYCFEPADSYHEFIGKGLHRKSSSVAKFCDLCF